MSRFRVSDPGVLDTDCRRMLLLEALGLLFPKASPSGLAEFAGELLRPRGEVPKEEVPERESCPEGGVTVYHLSKWRGEAVTAKSIEPKGSQLPRFHFVGKDLDGQGGDSGQAG